MRVFYKDTVVTQYNLLVILVVEFQAIETDVVRVTPRGQQLQLKYD